jgi:hypothetical protein
MERNAVDDNKDQTCSTGLHFCGLSYLDHFGGSDSRTVIVKIDPADVVSIPSDYNGAKGRACRYEVIGEMGVKAEDAFTAPVQSNANGTETVRAAKPVPELRIGDSAFKHGYSKGFMNLDYNNEYHGKDYTNYDNGYELGCEDREEGNPERWRYQAKPKPAAVNPAAQWPFPSKG